MLVPLQHSLRNDYTNFEDVHEKAKGMFETVIFLYTQRRQKNPQFDLVSHTTLAR